jgi:hypothetical protein
MASALPSFNPSSLVRIPIHRLAEDTQDLCDRLLVRGVSTLHKQLPHLLPACFGDGYVGSSGWADGAPASITHDTRLVFTPGEPACNVYIEGGQFRPHEDRQSLTVLVVLSDAEEFDGGGTAFWSVADTNRVQHRCWPWQSAPQPASPAYGAITQVHAPPAVVVKPPAGTAIIFGGDVTHAGQPVDSGERTLFVASFSLKDG